MHGNAITRSLASPSPTQAAVLFLFVAAWVGFAESTTSFYFLRDDNATYYLPAYVHNVRALQEDGELAFLNLHQSLGLPHLQAGQPATLYPPIYLAVLLADAMGDVRLTVTLLIGAHLWLAGLGILALLRHLGVSSAIAWASTILGITAPFVTFVGRSWIVVVFALTFSVWSLYLLLRLVAEPTLARILTLAGIKCLFFLTGYPQFFVYSVLYEGAFLTTVWILDRRSRRAWRRQVVALTGAAIAAAVWAAPLLLPMLSAVDSSQARSSHLPVSTFLENSARPDAIVAAQWFDFGRQEIFSAPASIFYIGLPLLLSLAWAIAVRCRDGDHAPGKGRFASFILVGLLALVSSTEAWGTVYGLPLLSSFRWPFKHFLFLWLYIVPAAALAVETLLIRRRTRSRSIWPLWLLLGSALSAHPLLLLQQGDRASFGAVSLPEPIERYRLGPLVRLLDPHGRVAVFRGVGAERILPAKAAPSLLPFNWATLLGVYQFSGYEPLLSRESLRLTLDTKFGVLDADSANTSAHAFSHLGRWSVTDVLAPSRPGVRASIQSSGAVRLVTSHNGIDLYKTLVYRPLVERLDGSGTSGISNLEVRTNSIEFEVTSDIAAPLRVAVTPLDGWTVYVDGKDAGPPDEYQDFGVVLHPPVGRHSIGLRYVEPRFAAGVALAALGAVLVLVTYLVMRRL